MAPAAAAPEERPASVAEDNSTAPPEDKPVSLLLDDLAMADGATMEIRLSGLRFPAILAASKVGSTSFIQRQGAKISQPGS